MAQPPQWPNHHMALHNQWRRRVSLSSPANPFAGLDYVAPNNRVSTRRALQVRALGQQVLQEGRKFPK